MYLNEICIQSQTLNQTDIVICLVFRKLASLKVSIVYKFEFPCVSFVMPPSKDRPLSKYTPKNFGVSAVQGTKPERRSRVSEGCKVSLPLMKKKKNSRGVSLSLSKRRK